MQNVNTLKPEQPMACLDTKLAKPKFDKRRAPVGSGHNDVISYKMAGEVEQEASVAPTTVNLDRLRGLVRDYVDRVSTGRIFSTN